MSREKTNYELGFDGERQTAQFLIPLIANGYQVFHDLPYESSQGKSFNLDHVVVGSKGVFVIETKARSKPAKGKAEVAFDGSHLQFPSYSDAEPIEQAKRNARHLAQELQRRTGEKIEVFPMVVLPGWWVNRLGASQDVVVLNPKEVGRHIESMPNAALTDKVCKQIIGYFEEKAEISPDDSTQSFRPRQGGRSN